ncbi:MAG: hypothetical protein HY260_04305 [Chloroflexi bacterium]|nr:hypothetical protein [Chloroflexota bacterium]
MRTDNSQHSGLGFHYFPDDAHYGEKDLAAWLPELSAMGVAWLTLAGSLARAIPESFIKGLIANGIEPIVHLPAAPVRSLDQDVVGTLMRAYASWGVRYVVVFAEPNSRQAWTPADWGKTGLIERFADILLPCLRTAADAGLVPVFPPLAPGGDYWDTAFLDATLIALTRRGEIDLLRQTAFAAYLWTFNRPLECGHGGATRWRDAQPYLTPPGCEDQRGFHLFDWYDEIVRARLGVSRPILCLAGGARLGDDCDPRFPAMDEARHTSCNLQIASAAVRGALPEYVLNISFWLLAADARSSVAGQAAYCADGTTLPFVPALKQLAFEHQLVRPKMMTATQPAIPKAGPKPVYHYVLMPVFEWGISEWHWNATFDYVRAFRPALGFSPNEAALARYVTIVGNEQGVPSNVEQSLKNAGCVVDRVAGKDGDETRAKLSDMARRNQRFQNGVG